MAVESIGAIFPTSIPGLADAADIQAALRAYHYGSYAYDPANTSTAALEANSIAKFLFDIETDITALESRPSSGGEVDTTEPAAIDFTPAEIPDGFIWVDEDGSLGGAPIGATAVFTNSAPTTSITTGTIWVDKDETSITANPFIPQALINAKGDLIAGSANDTATVLPTGTNGQVLKVNSATTSGLEWGADNSYAAPTLGSTSIASGATVANVAGLTINSTTIPTSKTLVDTDSTQTMSAKTLTNPLLSSPEESTNIIGSAPTATQTIDFVTSGVHYFTSNSTSNVTLNFRGNGSTTLNSMMATGGSITISVLITNGATPYYASAYQVDGNAVTPKWSGGTAPSAGNASSIDFYSFNILKTGDATFTVFASGASKFA
jgi:hypothetical protein